MWQSGVEHTATTWTTPALADGGPYYWCLYAYDGANDSGWSAGRAFYIDTAHNVAWLSDATPSTVYTNATYLVSVQVRNAGNASWPSSGTTPVYLSYHWINSGGSTVVFDGARTSLPGNIPPGGQATLSATLIAPNAPGNYTLRWDMVHEHVTWFSERAAPTRDVSVRVDPNAPPHKPLPLAPGQLAVVSSRTVSFSWQDTGDPDNGPRTYRTYSLQVATDPGFTDLVAGVGWMWQPGTEYAATTWTVALPSDGFYYWRVYAFDGITGSGWGNPRTFTVDTSAPPAPALVSATDGSLADRVRITWSGVLVATEYEVWRNTASAAITATRIATTTAAATAYDDSGCG
jgi:hypothetical protein